MSDDAEASSVDAPAPDALLLDDLSMPSDLKTKVTAAWHEFARALAGVIQSLDLGVHVDLTLDPTATGTGHAIYEVSVQRHADGRIGALAVSNAGLPEGHRLTRDAVAEMVILGWSPPGVLEGSGKDFALVGALADAGTIAVTITKTLRDVYGAPHPAFLTYTAHDADEADVDRGVARHRPVEVGEAGREGVPAARRGRLRGSRRSAAVPRRAGRDRGGRRTADDAGQARRRQRR